MDQQKLLSQSAIKERGWTQRMIDRLLPTPTLKANPRFRSAAPMKVWPEQLVLSIEETPEFFAEKEKAESRKRAAQKAVTTKTAVTRQEAQDFISTVRITVIPYGRLKRIVLDEKQAWYALHMSGNFAYDADETTVTRWMVNYIRHNLTEYDNKLYQLQGKTGKDYAHYDIKSAILDKIAAAYPELAGECMRQKEDRA